MEYQLIVDYDRIGFDDFVEFSKGDMQAQARVFMSCLADDKGNYLSKEEAEEVRKSLTVAQYLQYAKVFTEAMPEIPLPSKTKS
jgi:hypothetical protein